MTKMLFTGKRGNQANGTGRRRSLQRQFLTRVLVLLVAVITVLCVFAIHYVSASAEEALQGSMKVTSKYMAGVVASRVENFGTMAQTISVVYQNKQTQDIVFSRQLQDWRQENLLTSYDVLDSSGRSLISGQDLSGNEVVQNAKTEPFLSNAIIQGDTVHFAYAHVYNGLTVLLTIPYEAVANLVNNVKVGSGDCYIMDKDGNKVAHTSINNVLMREKDNDLVKYKQDPKLYESVYKLESAMARGESGFQFFTTWDGHRKFGSYAPVAGTNGWSLDITAPREDFMKQVKSSIIAIVIIGLLSIAATALVIGMLIRRITKPLQEVELATTQLAMGDLSAKITHTSNDEIGSLADSARTLVRNLKNYIGNISEVLGKVADGDMTVTVDMEYQGEFSPIRRSMEHIIASFHDALTDINHASDQVSTSATQMSSAAQELSSGATEQAASLEETAATMQEISEHVEQNNVNVQSTKDMMQQTTQEIEKGNDQMQHLVGAMGEISDTSGQIGNIIKTIEDIAFQTNILALNAAVEAARAGEAGKGFAVVADEVRNLAAKSASAAKNTTSLIENAISAVKNGMQMTDEVRDSLHTIQATADRVSALLNDIAEASETQAASIQQTMTGIDQVSSVVQTNSAMAEQSAAASGELSQQADMLRSLLQKFRLHKDGEKTGEPSGKTPS